jgi:hypothetical protein
MFDFSAEVDLLRDSDGRKGSDKMFILWYLDAAINIQWIEISSVDPLLLRA